MEKADCNKLIYKNGHCLTLPGFSTSPEDPKHVKKTIQAFEMWKDVKKCIIEERKS